MSILNAALLSLIIATVAYVASALLLLGGLEFTQHQLLLRSHALV